MKRAKKNKIIIATIAALAVIAVVVVVLLMVNKTPSGSNKYVKGEMTLVDTLGAGSQYEAKVYISKNQELVFDVKNSKYLNLNMVSDVPVYDKYLDINDENNSAVEYVGFYLNDEEREYEDKPEIQYPAEYDIGFVSAVAGLQYNIKLKIDADVEYISGSMTEGEINNSLVFGYGEFSEKFGDISLPEKAIVTDYRISEAGYGGSEQMIEQGKCDYYLSGSIGQIVVMKASERDKIYSSLSTVTPRKITVNDVGVDIFTDLDKYIAVYTIGDNMYMNIGFSKADDSIKDEELINILKPFVK